MKKNIYDKLKELAEEAVLLGDNPTAIVIYSLLGAKKSGQSSLLAKHVQDFTKLVLLPNAEQIANDQKNSVN